MSVYAQIIRNLSNQLKEYPKYDSISVIKNSNY